MLKKISVLFLSLCLGLVFIISAYSKLFPIEPFEYNIVGTTFIGWKSSVLVARIIIAVEFYLGLLLIFSYDHKKTITLASGILMIFTLHLIYQIISKGNNSDCGCFGSMFSITPLQGILKNVAMLIVLFIIYKLHHQFRLKAKYPEIFVLIGLLATVFIINPVDYGYAKNYLDKPFENFPLKIDTVYNAADTQKIGTPAKDIRKGKFIVAFLSSTCSHCKIAARKFGVIHSENPDIPIYFFINGEDAAIKNFRRKSDSEKIPYSKLNGHVFVELGGLQLPAIFYLNNSIVEKQVDYFTLDQSHIEKWLSK